MPTYRNPFEKGKLIVHFNVEFPEMVDPKIIPKLEKLLPAKEESMIPDEYEEVDLHDFDPEAHSAGAEDFTNDTSFCATQ